MNESKNGFVILFFVSFSIINQILEALNDKNLCFNLIIQHKYDYDKIITKWIKEKVIKIIFIFVLILALQFLFLFIFIHGVYEIFSNKNKYILYICIWCYAKKIDLSKVVVFHLEMTKCSSSYSGIRIFNIFLRSWSRAIYS